MPRRPSGAQPGLEGLLLAAQRLTGDTCRRSIFGLPVMVPTNPIYNAWCMVILLLGGTLQVLVSCLSGCVLTNKCADLTYTAFVVPIGVGFSISDTTLTWAAVCDFVAGACLQLG